MGMYLLDELRKLECAPDRKQQAMALVKAFDYAGRQEIPQGGWLPHYRWPAERDIRCELLKQEDFFHALHDAVGDCALYRRLHRRFAANKKAMLALAPMDWRERSAVPVHRYPLYAGDFDRVVRRMRDGMLEGYRVTKRLLGRGGLASVYKAYDAQGAPCAFKLFRPIQTLPPGDRNDLHSMYSEIIGNVRRNGLLFSGRPFAALRDARSECESFIIMDLVPGRSIQSLLRRGPIPRETARVGLMAYASMLKALHGRGMVFVDNNWGALVIDGENAGIVDYDFVSTIEDANAWPKIPRTPSYASREHALRCIGAEARFGPISDLESFALMADRLLVGNHFISRRWTYGEYLRAAAHDLRPYPRERGERLPSRIREVVAGLIQYPRDGSLTIDDFIEAIGQDFK